MIMSFIMNSSAATLDLRQALDRATELPLDEQPAGVAAIPGHSVRLHQLCDVTLSRTNCFQYAMNIPAADIEDKAIGNIFPGANFVEELIEDESLVELGGPVDGCLVIYFSNGRPTHAGVVVGERVRSKWGSCWTHVWDHGVFDAPARYGDEVRFFAIPDDGVALYREWATNHGL